MTEQMGYETTPPADVEQDWFVLQVRTGKERAVTERLASRGYQSFLPLWTPVTANRRCRRRDATEPLFPGYVFCRIDFAKYDGLVVTTPGVIRIVGFGRRPTPVSSKEINALRRIVQSQLPFEPWTPEHLGENVLIVDGPFKALSGSLLRVKSQCRLVVEISTIRKAVAVEVDASWVALVRDSGLQSNHRALEPSAALPILSV